MPRGFATPQGLSRVVRRHGGGFGEHPPRAYLTVQDLDVLQALADITYVPEEICDAVASLVTMLDAELAEAQRYDPKFQPTRYLSTRTAVQATNVLRAVVVYDKIFGRTDRPLQVEHRDIEWLRYYLMLNGVDRETLTARISRETDPRERRQLDIMATEAEIFDRCYSKLPPVKAPIQPRKLELKQLETMAQQARGSGDPDALGNAVQALISATESGAADASEATTLLVDTVGTLFGKALKGGLTPDLGASGGLDEHGRQLSAMANTLERSAGQGRLLAQWLRGRLLQLVDEGMTLSVSPTSTTVELLASSPSTNDLRRQIDACFVRAESLLGLRRQLRLGHEGEAPTDRAWEQTLDKLETELSLLWDARFRGRAVALLARADRSPLDKVLRSLHPILTWIGADEERFSRLGRRGELLRRVTGPRIEPLVASAFTRIDGRNRKAVIAQVESVVAELRRAGLGEVITPERFVAWAVPCLTRDDPGLDPGPSTVCDRAAYECARSKEPEVSITDTLIRIAIAALPHERHTTDKPEHTAQTVWQTLRTLDASLQARVVQLDLGRINRGVTMLEGWWATLRQSPADDAPRSVTVLEAVVQSGYLRAIRADAEPLRLSTELLHIVEVFPSSQEQVGVLRQRLRRLDTDSTAVLVRMLETQADQAWVSALAPQTPS
ncbi:MAG: hypothetical protein K0V04_27975 [Deltaproteobacteria bacterium]|nr:hypothetical protein [Deltaproteobacteria bacterium]